MPFKLYLHTALNLVKFLLVCLERVFLFVALLKWSL